MNLLLLDPRELSPDGAVTLTGPRARHLLRVLRVTRGQPVRIGIIDGPLGEGIVNDVATDRVSLHCTLSGLIPARPPLDLLLALPRPKVLQRLWAQIAAIGVGHIALTNAAKVERDYFDTHVVSAETYRPLLIEGLQQARDTRVPTVSLHKRFRILVEDELDGVFGDGLRIVAEPDAARSIEALVVDEQGVACAARCGPRGWMECVRARAFEIARISRGRRWRAHAPQRHGDRGVDVARTRCLTARNYLTM